MARRPPPPTLQPFLDALGVPLVVGQQVVYSTAGACSTGELRSGTIVRSWIASASDSESADYRKQLPERIAIRRDDGRQIILHWSKRIVVMRQEDEADGWLRRQLASLAQRAPHAGRR